MRVRYAFPALAGVALLAAPLATTGGDAPSRLGLPPLKASSPLPPLPERSPRNANYTIEARLDTVAHTIEGSLVLEWRNTDGTAVSTVPFHLYWNAFRDNLSTTARGQGRRAPIARREPAPEREYGYTQVRAVRLLGEPEEDLLPTLRYVQPDDGNRDDRTVIEVATAKAVAPGATARFRIDWTSRIPHGRVGRAGWVHDYNFVVQWFPKIGVLANGKWNCHQFHPWSEFFADYGVYDVRITLPRGHVVGATGLLRERKGNPDGTETLRFHAEDVHDFAWTASRRFLERKARFDDPGYPPVDIHLLVQPEHAHLSDRYIEATRIALRSYGTWSAPYPYPQITVVDPAWNSASGGMEYPTLFTGGANLWAPPALRSPEGVTIHEAGHQFWYGLVANNEFEEAWLDEGFNRYHDEKAGFLALGPRGWGRRYFGPEGGRGSRTGWPVLAPGVWIGRGQGITTELRRTGEVDAMARRSWDYRTSDSYGLNSYGKPALTLQTLEALVGDETMTRILRTYARRFRFAHPTTEDFIGVVNDVTGQDYRWFFAETFFSSELCDYAIAVENKPRRQLEGFTEGPDGRLVLAPPPAEPESKRREKGPWEPQVTVLRQGGVRMPVEVEVVFSDGRRVREVWDGRDRWTRFTYPGPTKVVRAVVDPEGKLAVDARPANNSWVDEEGISRRSGCKWAARWMLWLQDLLELHTVLG